ncbi:MAG TPA: LacI family DNA-binding transcriptional regulator, partial [Roseimicrobium sp.]|nr:LacI family DNA-binding transcriptional regulator [Roseimicrobium sp.]
TFGLIVSQAPRWESLLIEGVDSAAVARKIGLMLVHVPHDDRDLPDLVTRMQVDGLIADWAIPKGVSEAIARYEIPTIWVNSDQQGENCVWPDDVAGGRVATEHLLALGHRRVAFVAVRQTIHISQERRLQGYHEAMAAAGLTPQVVHLDCPNVVPVEKTPEYFAGRYAHRELWQAFEAEGEPTACVLFNCDTAKEVYSSCQRKGRNPGDYAFVACDDQEWVETMVPAVSTILVDHAEMGRVAVELLCEKLSDGGKQMPTKIMPVQLLVRESSRRPAV